MKRLFLIVALLIVLLVTVPGVSAYRHVQHNAHANYRVQATPIPTPVPTPLPPVASFKIIDQSSNNAPPYCVGDTLSLRDTSIGTKNLWQWAITRDRDGVVAGMLKPYMYTQSPTVKLTKDGAFHVGLTVSSQWGWDWTRQAITIFPANDPVCLNR